MQFRKNIGYVIAISALEKGDHIRSVAEVTQKCPRTDYAGTFVLLMMLRGLSLRQLLAIGQDPQEPDRARGEPVRVRA